MDKLALISTAKEFGAEIRRQRKAAKLTQAELATAIGTTRRLLSALENGERGVSIEAALAAASELGLELRMEPRS
ncbi:transcriptional regulator with XRE-family HTH domain [Parvibaculum indicum]|uniref:helix-turn-helix domain-containing protein n=1 Tax=Parvibaculum TaxID=256616 RepID=UPI00141E3A64|nr:MULTISPECIES: helix-turn-helix domain-containing protein [Parvibaculum]NIJ41582.1 transcriptional regulator with XRE-family HTH domain [Parvibaculum indicum]